MGEIDAAARTEAAAFASADAAPPRALLEALDRDGQVRQSWRLDDWPLRIGRALDNDVVLNDVHVAANHLQIAPDGAGLVLSVGTTHNGVLLGAHRLAAGERRALSPQAGPLEFTAGRTRLRLRLASEALAAELPLAGVDVRRPRLAPTVVAALLLLTGMLLGTWLETDPDRLARAAGSTLLTTLAAGAVWCGAWALLSKTFTRQANFGWHLRVFVLAGLGLLLLNLVPSLLAFSFSWPWLSSYAFVGNFVIGAAALYFHMLGVEPSRARTLRWIAGSGAIVGVALMLWLNVQRTGRASGELYMSHLFPPALRLAPAQPVDHFVSGLAPLQAKLDRQARVTSSARGADVPDNDNDGDD